MITPELLHYFAVGLAISLGAIGTGIGQGIGAFSAVSSMSRQPTGIDQIFKTMVIGLAFIESGVILALVVTLLTMFDGTQNLSFAMSTSEIGIALAVGVAAVAISLASSFAMKSACKSVARQPFFSQKILTLMLLAQAIIEAPVVFAFIIGLIIRAGITESMTIFEGLKFLAAGTCMALGCIGPSAGQAVYAESSCRAVGLNKDAYSKLFSFSIVNEAVIETPLIFCLLVSILIIYMPISSAFPMSYSIGLLVAAITTSFGTFGTGVGTGVVGSKSCYQIAIEPDNYSVLFRTNLLAQAFIESAAIYALIIALGLITKTY
jgi:F-type H+-transporting ATPase subunit c